MSRPLYSGPEARLIIAAPDLYEALKAVKSAVDNGVLIAHNSGSLFAYVALLDKVEAALRKAEGQ